jgi:hypothetical protein
MKKNHDHVYINASHDKYLIYKGMKVNLKISFQKLWQLGNKACPKIKAKISVVYSCLCDYVM